MTKLLIVDDDDLVRNFLVDCLNDEGFDIVDAACGDEARQILSGEKIDIMITDLVMPGKNGIDLIMEIRKEKPDLEIIAISGGGGITGKFDYLPIAKLVGAKTILQKPVSPADLIKAVQSVAEN